MELIKLNSRHHQVIHQLQKLPTNTEKDSNGLTTTGVIKDADNMTLDSGFHKTPKI